MSEAYIRRCSFIVLISALLADKLHNFGWK